MTLADLRRAVELLAPGSSLTLSRDALLEALGTSAPADVVGVIQPAEPEQLLTVDEVAAQLGVSVRWCYDHAEQLGVRRLSRRCVRFSARAVQRHMTRKQRAGT